ncbi:MAG: YidC/Oxa1 family membrane protein insertase [Coriobacteriales bacterium]|nr:YidC/Oxa1 family membrane protein insertase [Coriobacteriales bacterium]
MINAILGIPLGYIFYLCYGLLSDYGLAILLFTLVTKALMFPLSLVAQKNAITMVRIQPLLEGIKQRFAGNNTLIMEEQKALYKREHYSLLKGMLPLLIQIPLILGLICVVYNPLQHLLHLDTATIRTLVAATAEVLGTPVAELGTGAQLAVMELVKHDPAALAGLSGMEGTLDRIAAVNLDFLGVDMAMVPSFAVLLTLLYPLLSGGSALLLSALQNRYYVLQLNAGFWGKWGTAAFLTAFSLYFAFVLPCGVGLYWIAGNLISIATMALCNLIYDPRKYLDFSTIKARPVLSRAEKAAKRERKKAERARQRIDMKRFYQCPDKQLVFYSEGSGFYKYFERVIAWLLAESDVIIHYVSSDLHDQIFQLELGAEASQRFQTYFVGQSALISFMMKMDADLVVMTMPDLEVFHIKRSLVRKDIEYVYLDHGMSSFHLALREHALDYFDTIFCYGPNHDTEVRRLEELHELAPKKLVDTGYPLLDDLLERVSALSIDQVNEPLVALIGPSWQQDNLMELCLPEVVAPLLACGFQVIVRPHPQYVRQFSERILETLASFTDELEQGSLVLERDFASSETVYLADVVITDWSTIAQEFSYATKKPSIFIDTPLKVMNHAWEDVELEPLDITLRSQIGRVLALEDLAEIGEVARELVAQRSAYRERIAQVMQDNLYHIGSAAEHAGGYLLASLAEHAQRHEEEQAYLEGSRAVPSLEALEALEALETDPEQPEATEVWEVSAAGREQEEAPGEPEDGAR